MVFVSTLLLRLRTEITPYFCSYGGAMGNDLITQAHTRALVFVLGLS